LRARPCCARTCGGKEEFLFPFISRQLDFNARRAPLDAHWTIFIRAGVADWIAGGATNFI
jgi:hypothetical protein